ncbi:hypothetical protein COU74_01970 [Candidatus Peregrinibacteria bacterium CG10_big_fil_rev_8_21_14_0_10_36_19]|nr:MAG: hypothetical protein COU74_01970 [Candidatus Peregrinibacteria bacterium CG10_big_fil_rev_8_21_14_0_10_36_19]
MKKIIKQLAVAFLFVNLALTINSAFAAPIDDLTNIGKDTGLPSFYETGQHPDALPDYAQSGVGTLTSPIFFIIDLFRYVISTVAVLMIVINAIKLTTITSDEEAEKSKTTLIVAVVGLLLVQFADVAVRKMFFGDQGEAFQDVATVQIYAQESVKQFRGIIGFLEALLGAVAVLVLVVRGFALIAGGGDEEGLTKAKDQVLYALIGLGVVALSEVVIRGVIFPEAGAVLPDTEKANFVIVTLTNYIAGFVATLSFATLFYGGYLYVTAAGNEEQTAKVKKIFISATLALVISLGAFAVVNTLIQFKPTPQEELSGGVQVINDSK